MPSTDGLFDFISYLRLIDPSQIYKITHLSGGLVNVTVRATKVGFQSKPKANIQATRELSPSPSITDTDATGDDGPFKDNQNIVIKYAPPFIATIGESAPFSPYRQIIEAKALTLLNGTQSILDVLKHHRISIPQILYHDPTASILIISDLGSDLCTIDKALSTEISEDFLASLASRLGAFFATLHTLPLTPTHLLSFRNKDASEVIKREVIDRLDAALISFDVAEEERYMLQEMLNKEIGDHSTGESERVFCLGDCWPGSILVNPMTDTVGIVDWEFAGPGKAMQDLVQLGSHLRILSFSTAHTSPSTSSRVSAFTEALFTAYNKGCISLNAPWLVPSSPTQSTLIQPIRDHAIRPAWILFGREIIFAAAEALNEVRSKQRGGDRLNEEQQIEVGDAMWMEEAAECGLGYLRAAKKGLTEDDLEEEKSLGRLYAG